MFTTKFIYIVVVYHVDRNLDIICFICIRKPIQLLMFLFIDFYILYLCESKESLFYLKIFLH
jgi:hypothetical protein